jgi:hypothetical protein
MFATMHFVGKGDLDDTFALAEILVHDEHELVQQRQHYLGLRKQPG